MSPSACSISNCSNARCKCTGHVFTMASSYNNETGLVM